MIGRGHRVLQCILAAVVLGCAVSSALAAAIATVYPTGSFPLDVITVQFAIDRGGTVLLKATNAAGVATPFDFGPADPFLGSGVNLNTDVTILGEQAGNLQTTIKGGFLPILGLVPVKSRIQGIHFDGPLDSPIVIIRSTGADILGNRITGIVPLPLFFGGSEIEGIFVSGFDDPLNAITGRINVIGNVIEVAGGDFVNGMQFDEVAADVVIKGNTVSFIHSDGVLQTDGILVFRSHGNVDIVQNQVTMGVGDFSAFPVGIFAGGHAEAKYRISGNSVVTQHPNSDGIDVTGLSPDTATVQAMVQGNDVAMQSTVSTSGGVVFVGAVQRSAVVANRVRGTGGNAIQVMGLSADLLADSNRAVGNDISGLSSLFGDVLLGFGSVNTLVAGQCDTYIDIGVADRVLCGMPLAIPGGIPSAESRRGPAMKLQADVLARARLDAMRGRMSR
jgi:hypothetical protein